MTVKSKVLYHLKSGGKISVLSALNMFGTTSLLGIIYRLRQDGHQITDCRKRANNGSFYKVYFMSENRRIDR